jgi:hypothetical protein
MKMNLIRVKMILLAISLASCESLPAFPEIEQSGYSYKYKKFRACDTTTHKCRDIPLSDPSMEGAQCLSPEAYKKSEAWIQSVIDIANTHCR